MFLDIQQAATHDDAVANFSEIVPYVNKIKFLGLISSDIQWEESTKIILPQDSTYLFGISKLMLFKASLSDLVSYFCSFSITILKYASVFIYDSK